MALPTVNATLQPWDTSVGNRFAHYSPDDHSALLWIATLVSMIYAVGMFLLEVLLKRISHGREDGFMLLSLVGWHITWKRHHTDFCRLFLWRRMP